MFVFSEIIGYLENQNQEARELKKKERKKTTHTGDTFLLSGSMNIKLHY